MYALQVTRCSGGCRIIKADFPRLPELSADCLSLLDEMLNVDADSRITVQGITQHPW